MSNRIFAGAFVLGLAAALWVGFGFIGTHPLALAMTGAILVVFLAGAQELRQYRHATAALARAVDGTTASPAALGDWLEQVPQALREPVRLRIESGRGGLPAPALTPYLAGLLVMLGMLGTFLGMVVTFRGTVFALEGSADLQAMRAALAEPIRGLGLSFGTSVAGVATSAMLGLMATLARRERLEVARRLDRLIATALRPFTAEHQRQDVLRGLQAQAGSLPDLAARLATLADTVERRQAALGEQLLASQERFQRDAGLAYTGLAERVAGALQDSLAAGARAAGESLRPVVALAMERIEQQALGSQSRVEALARMQAEAVQAGLTEAVSGMATQVDRMLGASAGQLAEMAQASRAGVAEAVAGTQDLLSLSSERNQAQVEALLGGAQRQLEQAMLRTQAQLEEALARTQAQLQQSLDGTHEALQQGLQGSQALLDASLQGSQALLDASLQGSQARLDASLDGSQARLAAALEATQVQLLRALDGTQALLVQAGQRTQAQLQQLLSTTQSQLVQLIDASQAQLAQLREEEARRGEAAVDRLGALEVAVGGHLATLGQSLEAPLARLLHTAAEVPQAGAELLARLREEMSALSQRDQLALQERTALMERLGTLVDALQRGTAEQQVAVESLAGAASRLIEQAAGRFESAVAAQAGQAAEAGAHLQAGAIELSSLAQAFGAAIHQFQSGNERLLGTLQQVESALERSAARSDEQLAYYVAQAREVIDLSIASQQGLLNSLHEASAASAASAARAGHAGRELQEARA